MTGTIESAAPLEPRTGELLAPGDPGYDEARSVWNGAFDRRPATIARCRSDADVAAAIALARERDLEIAVRGGGHSFSGASICDGGLMIDLSPMRDVSVDAVARRAVCGGGASWADVDAATQAHGLATTGGIISHTGIGGLTLGGGMGWLTRQFGLTIDNLASARVVTADGRVLRAAEDENAELFWGLRGGGGNFGVVTSFEYRLHEVGPTVHVGLLFWDTDKGVDMLRLCREYLPTLPRESGCFMALGLTAPPLPFVPDQHRGVVGHALLVAGFGSAEEHGRLLEPVRAVLPPLFEVVTPMPYTGLQQLVDDSAPWGVRSYDKSLYLDDLSDEVIALLAEGMPLKNSPMSFGPVFWLDGAYTDVADDATAFGGRRAPCYAVEMAAVAPTDDLLEADTAWSRGLWERLRPHARGSGSYVNFMGEYERDRVRSAYGAAKYERLARLKAEYDPENMLHRNANIEPATPAFREG
ncbi:MAG: FAD-binding oxidoreductase [Streptosporangiales bacterium]